MAKLQALLGSALVTAQQPTVNTIVSKVTGPAEIAALVAINDPAVDAALLRNINTPQADLTTIIGRIPVNPASDLLALCHPNLSVPDAARIDGRNLFVDADFQGVVNDLLLPQEIKGQAGRLGFGGVVGDVANGVQPASVLFAFRHVIQERPHDEHMLIASRAKEIDEPSVLQELNQAAKNEAMRLMFS